MSVLRNCCAILAVALVATACTEKLGSGRACPDLCPIQEVFIADTTIPGVIVDSTVFAGPTVGSESRLLLATRTDGAIDLRGVIRFDTLPNNFKAKGAAASDSAKPIASVAGAQLVIVGDSVGNELLPKSDFTISAYDVDTSGVADTAVAPVAALFTPSRLLGTATFAGSLAADTMLIPLNGAAVASRMIAGRRLRIGLRIESGGNTTIRVGSTTSGHEPMLRYRPSATADTTQADDSVRTWFVNSKTPLDDAVAKAQLADYTLIVKGTPAPPTGVFAVGGVPGRRTYLAFDVPKRLLDSTQIVRATLRLTQIPSPLSTPSDTGRLQTLLGTAKSAVGDLAKRTLFHEPLTYDVSGRIVGAISGLPEVKLKADTSAARSIEVAPILRQWRGVDPTEVPHTIIFQLPTEGLELTELWFSSIESSSAQRPTLQITYVPRNAPGIP